VSGGKTNEQGQPPPCFLTFGPPCASLTHPAPSEPSVVSGGDPTQLKAAHLPVKQQRSHRAGPLRKLDIGDALGLPRGKILEHRRAPHCPALRKGRRHHFFGREPVYAEHHDRSRVDLGGVGGGGGSSGGNAFALELCDLGLHLLHLELQPSSLGHGLGCRSRCSKGGG
jgi:hypothetical protein